MVYWIFGYGSLIWKPPPHAVEKRSGYVKGVLRRFAQSSIDHRGTPERPGRVVTVIEAKDWRRLVEESEGTAKDHPEEQDVVWGMAYRIDPEHEEEVRAYMEWREKNGYTAHDVSVYRLSNEKEEIVVPQAQIWIGKLDNEAFIGYEPLDKLAARIASCEGPSGPNRDYLHHLAQSVAELYPHVKDDYLFELDACVRSLGSM